MAAPRPHFPKRWRTNDRALKDFLFENMYKHPKVTRMTGKARGVVHGLFGLFFEQPETLPPPWRHRAEAGDPNRRARVIADYIAGMTDRFAMDEHARLFAAEH